MNYFQRRRIRKSVRHLLHEARHARHMKEDVVEQGILEELRRAESTLSEAAAATPMDEEAVDQAAERVSGLVARVMPPRSQPALRENIEILVVAVAVAMGFRAYFLQPFKIPTGSMQPTLNGITVEKEYTPSPVDKVPLRYAKYLLTGDRYLEVRAKASGRVSITEDARRNQFLVIGSKRHKVYKDMEFHVSLGQNVSKGKVLATGLVKAGDHIFVDKLRYNFLKPKRGDIIVFTTEGIRHPQIQHADHYIKRLVGLPGEKISVKPPHLVVNGEKVTEPFPFQRMLGKPYHGYQLAPGGATKLSHEDSVLKLADDQFLPFGDNTGHSLDGRFFGGVDVENLIGPAFAVYWPFGPHWGRVR